MHEQLPKVDAGILAIFTGFAGAVWGSARTLFGVTNRLDKHDLMFEQGRETMDRLEANIEKLDSKMDQLLIYHQTNKP